MAEIGKDLEKAAALLREGKLVAIPTETVYGLAANALNPEAVTRIFEVKDRPYFDPLIVHTYSFEEAKKYASSFPDTARRLAKEFWPGPLTLVLPKKNEIPDIVTAGQSTVGLRVPNHELTLKLLRGLPFPLAAPSANPFGYVSPTTPQHVNDQLGEKIDYILDGGDCAVGIESTIISFAHGNNAEVLRLGGLEILRIAKITGSLREILHQNSDPSAPGQLDQHYAPGCALVPESGEPMQWKKFLGKKICWLRFKELQPGTPVNDQFVLAPDGKMSTAATRLFSLLRQMDKENYEIAIVEAIPDEGLGRAINDRLKRAGVR